MASTSTTSRDRETTCKSSSSYWSKSFGFSIPVSFIFYFPYNNSKETEEHISCTISKCSKIKCDALRKKGLSSQKIILQERKQFCTSIAHCTKSLVLNL